MSDLIAPHGGKLINRQVQGAEATALADKAKSLPQVKLNVRSEADLEMVAVGAFSPLTGFLGNADYSSVVKDMHLTNNGGVPWSLPITLTASRDDAKSYEGKQVALVSEEGIPLAI